MYQINGMENIDGVYRVTGLRIWLLTCSLVFLLAHICFCDEYAISDELCYARPIRLCEFYGALRKRIGLRLYLYRLQWSRIEECAVREILTFMILLGWI